MKKIYALIACCTVLILWCCAATVYINPAVWSKYFALIGLGFPFCAMAVITIAVLGLLAKTKLTLIPLFGLLACFGSLRDYCPINISSPAPKGCIKVMTYNTMGFGNWRMNEKGELDVVRYICEESPDIATLQETVPSNEKKYTTLVDAFQRYGYYYQAGTNKIIPVAIVSRWRIARSEKIFQSGGNSAVAFYIARGHNDTLIVISSHLQSMQLTPTDRQNYHEIVKNPEEADTIQGKRQLIMKIAEAGPIRALQADTLATYLDRHKGEKIILMGDFNDTPISYAHHQICFRLIDAYRATGNGIGRSFNRDAIYVRIDNIFCSNHFKPFAARVEEEIPFSDHYPVISYLQERSKK